MVDSQHDTPGTTLHLYETRFVRFMVEFHWEMDRVALETYWVVRPKEYANREKVVIY